MNWARKCRVGGLKRTTNCQELLKTSELLKYENGKSVPNIRFNLFIFPSQHFKKQQIRSGAILHIQLSINYTRLRSWSHPSTHPTVQIKHNWFPNVTIKPTVLMKPWECKPRHPQGTRYLSTIIAFTCGVKEPNVMSPQSRPREVGIN
jgi:hypothetical protein